MSDEQMEPSRTYKQGIFGFIFGCIFALAGTAFAGAPVYYALTGQPMPMGGPNHSTHPASPSEMIGFGSFALIFVLVGVLVALYTKNWSITVEPEGVVTKNLLGQEAFRARWEELTGLVRRYARGGPYYRLQAAARAAMIPAGTKNMADLLADIHRHAPQLPQF